MKRLIGLSAALVFVCVILSASPVSAGIPYCWFNKYIKPICGTYVPAPTTVTAAMGENVEWWFMIKVAFPGWDGGMMPIENVVVIDRFGAEIEIDDYEPGDVIPATHGTASYITKGKSEKVVLTWDIGTLWPGDVATLQIKISTDKNPAGHQEYTSPNCYELNSGAVLKFTYEGKKYSAYTESIMVEVEGTDD